MRSRTRLIAIVASLLVCIAMVGTGFASWVILDKKTGTGSGNVTAEAIANAGLVFTVADDDAEIKFGSPANSEWSKVSNAWLVEGADQGEGKFVATLTLTIRGNVGSITFDFATGGNNSANYTTAAAAKLIKSNPTFTAEFSAGSNDNKSNITQVRVVNSNGNTITDSENSGNYKLQFSPESTAWTDGADFTDEGENSVTVTIKATFSWGDAFKVDSVGTNPYFFFNSEGRTVDGTTATEGKTNLSDWIGTKGINNSKITEYSSGTGKTPTNWGEAAQNVLGWMNASFAQLTYDFTFTATAAKTAAPTKS